MTAVAISPNFLDWLSNKGERGYPKQIRFSSLLHRYNKRYADEKANVHRYSCQTSEVHSKKTYMAIDDTLGLRQPG